MSIETFNEDITKLDLSNEINTNPFSNQMKTNLKTYTTILKCPSEKQSCSIMIVVLLNTKMI